MSIGAFQVWLVAAIGGRSAIAMMMRTAWAWPIAESLHFLGLCLLIGGVGMFDLRLLGVARRVPIAAMHRFIPWGIAGFVITAASGVLFVLTEPDQYIYNWSFHWKLVFIIIAGANAGVFYLTSWRLVFGSATTFEAPRRARVIAAISLSAWVLVIVFGRLITWYRPLPCLPTDVTWLLACSP